MKIFLFLFVIVRNEDFNTFMNNIKEEQDSKIKEEERI